MPPINCKEEIKTMKRTFSMSCDDGFSVHSHNKREVIMHGLMHLKTMHPEMKVSKDEMDQKIEMH